MTASLPNVRTRGFDDVWDDLVQQLPAVADHSSVITALANRHFAPHDYDEAIRLGCMVAGWTSESGRRTLAHTLLTPESHDTWRRYCVRQSSAAGEEAPALP